MNKRILAFGASNSKHSINRIFANYVANEISDTEVKLLDLNEFEMPIYSIDRERESGIPEQAKTFKKEILQTDAIVISFAEYNGSYTTAFKNIFDWVSRLEGNIWSNKPMILLATSPGGRGGRLVLETATKTFSFMNRSKIVNFSLPSFKTNFDIKEGIVDKELRENLESLINEFSVYLKSERIN